MTMTATRDDATTTVTEFLFGAKNKTPDQLVADALSAFTSAEKKLTDAVTEIERQESELVKQQAELQVKLSKTDDAKGRLTRIKQRITDLLA